MVGLLEAANPLRVRAGEGAAFVAEQFAFQQGFGNRRAVDGDERRVGAVAVLVNGAGDEFLARAGFAANEHGDRFGGHPADFLVDVLHGLAPANERVATPAGFAQADRFGHPAVAVGRFADQFDQLRNVERLEQIIIGANFHRFDGGFGGAKRGDQNDGQTGLGRVQLPDEFQAVQARQLQVGDDKIEWVFDGAGPGRRRRAFRWPPHSLPRPAPVAACR